MLMSETYAKRTRQGVRTALEEKTGTIRHRSLIVLTLRTEHAYDLSE